MTPGGGRQERGRAGDSPGAPLQPAAVAPAAEPPSRFFLYWRTTVVRDREIVDAVVRPEHRGPSAALRAALVRWGGRYYRADGDGDGRWVLVRALGRPRRERWWLHATLFLVTFATVWMGGSLLYGAVGAMPVPLGADVSMSAMMLDRWLAEVAARGVGFDFAMALMAILLAHETGHYLAAKRYGIDVSPPYFLPAPPQLNFIGTFGAFIRLRSPIVDRRQLLDVGAAGPWVGFGVALIALAAGLARSTIVPQDGASEQLILIANHRLYLGDSPMLWAARRLLVGEGTVVLHPLAFAGWIGMFITMLNLMPLGQLDGGHVLYALVGKWQARLGFVVWAGLVALGFWAAREAVWQGVIWWVWAGVLLILGRGRFGHPAVLDRVRPLPPSRHPLGWVTALLFVATFTPVPIHY